MLKDRTQMDSDAHFTYEETRKKVRKEPNKDLVVFASVFLIGVLIILGFAKILSPNVDVSIMNEPEFTTSYPEDDEESNASIDERLRKIQMEDSGEQEGDKEMFSPELDEKVVLPQQQHKTVGQMEVEFADKNKSENIEQNSSERTSLGQKIQEKVQKLKSGDDDKKSEKPIEQEKSKDVAPVPKQIINARVVVGSYATEKQAEVAKSILQESGLNIVPLVKNIGGSYTLQVGSYSTQEKAQQAANKLLNSNYPARVVLE